MALPTTGSEASPETIRNVAVEAESRGWRTVWTVERMLCPDPTVAGAGYAREHYRHVFDPLESIAWAAAHTSSVRFGTSVLNALFHPPVVLARDVCHRGPPQRREACGGSRAGLDARRV